MGYSIQQLNIAGLAVQGPVSTISEYERIFQDNRHRVYSFAFWMTDNELQAEEILEATFRRAFAQTATPSSELIDRMLLAEVREFSAVGTLQLQCGISTDVAGIRHNVKRVHLERAVVQLPATERLIFVMHDGESYEHQRIARTLGITEQESQHGLHQARLRIRELVASMD